MDDREASEGQSSSDDGKSGGGSASDGRASRERPSLDDASSGGRSVSNDGAPVERLISFDSASETETTRLGQALGGVLKGGDVAFAEGPLGAGKTCLIRGICTGLGFNGRVRSPSFAVVNQYDGRCRIYHVDLYRIPPDSPELEDLSRQEYFSDDAVTLVEWGEKLASWGVDPALNIRIHIGEGERRRIEIEAADPVLAERVRELRPG